MKILTAKQIQQADAFTIEHQSISALDLMERAANQCFDWFVHQYTIQSPVHIFCGVGNNGGDGLALARMLSFAGYEVCVYEIPFSVRQSPSFLANKQRIKLEKMSYTCIESLKQIPIITPQSVVVDAIFGVGLSRNVSKLVCRLFHVINQSGAQVVAIDMPSGLYAETNQNNKLEAAIQAQHTLTFQQPKLAYFFPNTHHYFGNLHILDIGLDINFIEKTPSNFYFSTLKTIKTIYRKRSSFVHKGNMGRALLVAGSLGKMGACVLAAKACKRAGVGLLTVHVPKVGYKILQTIVPEAMTLTDINSNFFSQGLDTTIYSVVAVGPGLGIKKSTIKALQFLISETKCPMVIDADALNILAKQPELWRKVPQNSIITPHRGEWERISGIESSDSFLQLQAAQNFAVKHKIVVVLKDAITAVIDTQGTVFFNSTGNAGLATGGSGDVLTGIIAALIAQGYQTTEAAKLGVFLHGLAADIAITHNESPESLIASDVIDYLGRAFQYVAAQSPKN